jgi:carbon-monoxide dehydrogenase medium subunit
VEFTSAASVEEVTAHLVEHGTAAQILAGGTDVMLQQARGEISPELLIHIGRIPGLTGVTANGTVRIGPLTTHHDLATNHLVLITARALAEAAATVGGWQTQAIGTIGGNVCNASPAADTAAPLLVAGASFELTGPAGSRMVPGDAFFVGRRQTARASDEILTAIVLPHPAERTGDAYLKVGRRSAMEVAVVGLAVRITLDIDGTVERARIATCSVAPAPMRMVEAEEILQGSRLDPQAINAAGDALTRAASPIDDARATATYRTRVLPGLLARALGVAATRAEGGAG